MSERDTSGSQIKMVGFSYSSISISYMQDFGLNSDEYVSVD